MGGKYLQVSSYIFIKHLNSFDREPSVVLIIIINEFLFENDSYDLNNKFINSYFKFLNKYTLNFWTLFTSSAKQVNKEG